MKRGWFVLFVVFGVIILSAVSYYSLTSKAIVTDDSNKIGMANPASVYCKELGYEIKKIKSESGERGICIMPDKTECEEWEFYRGLCGQKWSYCEKKGYSVKEAGKNDRWIEGTVCIDGNTGKEIGAIAKLMDLENKVKAGCVK